MRILIVKLSAIGDIVHTLPALAVIRQGLPEAEIDWAVETSAAEILRGNPLIGNLIEINTKDLRQRKTARGILAGLRQHSELIRSRNYDAAIDFQGLIKSALITRLSGAPLRFGFSRENLREPAAAIFYNHRINTGNQINIIESNIRLAAEAFRLDIPADIEFPIFPDNSHISEAEDIAAAAGGHFAILNPGGGWPTKIWDAGRFGRLADLIFERLQLRSVLTYGPGEENLAKQAAEACSSGSMLTVSPALRALYSLCRKAEIFIGGDTGPTHIAVAAGTPVVGIFGPTDWIRNGSPFAEDVVVERNDIDCRKNCYRRSCGKWICMNIDVETVFSAVKRRLQAKENFRTRVINANAEAQARSRN